MPRECPLTRSKCPELLASWPDGVAEGDGLLLAPSRHSYILQRAEVEKAIVKFLRTGTGRCILHLPTVLQCGLLRAASFAASAARVYARDAVRAVTSKTEKTDSILMLKGNSACSEVQRDHTPP
jgi:hypothetical protein